MRALALLVMLPLASQAADMTDCKVYATRTSAMALKALLGIPFIDVSTGRFLFRKAYTFCVNADEVPALVFTEEEQPIVDGLPAPKLRPEPPPASVPAVDVKPEPEPVGKSGFARGSDQWTAWCRKHFPRSWDRKTSTVILPTRKKVRVPCPG